MIHYNKNKFLLVIAGFATVFVLSVSMVQAQTPLGNNASLQELVLKLQEQIKALQGQVFELKTQVQSQEKELVAVKLELQFTKTLQKGASGEDVKKLQEFLRSFQDVYPEGIVSGYFGPLTETAVKKFQEKSGLEPVGVVGPKTRAILNDAATGNCSANTTRPCFDRRAGDKIFILNEGAGNNAFVACLNNPSENKTGELFEKTALCDEEKIQYCYEGQSANLIRKFEGSCQVKPVPILPPAPAPTPLPSPIPTPLPTVQPVIKVLSPNGGEKILQGSTFIIQWSTTNLVSKSVNIALYQYKDGTWTYWNTIATNVPQGTETGTFTYEWKTLNFDIDRDFFIEVSGAGAYPSPTDKSDQPFHFISNYSVQVVTPNGGESWTAGSGQVIRWSATKLQSFPTAINLLKGGVMYRALSTAVLPDYYDGTAFVKKLAIPFDVPSGSDYTIEVLVPAIWSTIPEARDVSDKPFSIISTTVISPASSPSPLPSPTTYAPTNARGGWGITRDNSNRLSLYFHAINFTLTEQFPSALRVYLKKPGESIFTRAAEFTSAQFNEAAPCNKIVTTGSTSYQSWWTMFRFCNSNNWKIDSYLLPVTGYLQGEYQFYLAAIDNTGKESVSPAFGMYNLSPLTILAPTSLQSPVGSSPLFQWTVASGWPASPAPYTVYIYDEANFAFSKEIRTATVDVPTTSTIGTYLYDGPALDPAKKYRVLMTGLKRSATYGLCPSCDYISMDVMPQTFWVGSTATAPPPSPTIAAAPIAPYDLKIVNGYSPTTEPPKLFAQLFFKYALQTDSKSINVYVKKPTDSQFVKYAHDAQLTVKNGYTQIGESYMSYTPSTQAWVWDLVPWKSSEGWPPGTYKYYVTVVNTSGVESSPSSELPFTIIEAPIFVYPASNQTVSLPLSITVKDPAGTSCANARVTLYKTNGTSQLWEKVFCASITYDGPVLTSDGNPYRLVAYGSGLGGVSMSRVALQYFNVPVSSSDKPDLTIQDIYIESNTNYLSLKLSNIGTAAAPDTGHLYIWIDDVLKWTYSFSTFASTQRAFLSPGGVTIAQPQALTGEHRVKATIDPNNVIAELNEANNTMEKTVTSVAAGTSSPVTVISPNGGECRAGIFPITWSSSLGTKVAYWDLSYSLNNGSSFWYFVSGVGSGARSYNWATWATQDTTSDNINSNQALMRVEARGPTFPYGALLGADVSDNVLSLNLSLNATCPGGLPPVASTGLTATPRTDSYGTNVIDINWTDNSINEVGFAAYQRVQGSSQWSIVPVETERPSLRYYLLPGTYEFKVRAGNQYGYSTDSNIATATVGGTSTTTSSINSDTVSQLAQILESLSSILNILKSFR